jgi:cell fate (sporulation/competence/biofilm development) regulator YmcA (YheA/YmcA/DUF963 family)
MAKEIDWLKIMTEQFHAVQKSGDEEAYLKLSSTFDKMQKELRVFALNATLPAMKEVLEKLKDEVPLSPGDLEHLKSWIVGDAQYYIAAEKNFNAWSAQLQEVVKSIGELWSAEPDLSKVILLRALTRDASKIIANLAYFVKQTDSVKKFNTAIQKIGESERLVLISLLEQKISSSNF